MTPECRRPETRTLQQLANFHLDQLQKLVVVNKVNLVHEDHDVGHAYLTGQQDVLARLRHRTVGRRYHQDRTVHLGRTRDHVLDIVRVTRTVYVRVVTVLRLVLHVSRRNRDTTLALLRSVVNRIKRADLVTRHALGQGPS